MLDKVQLTNLDWWLADVRGHFIEAEPDLLPLFEVYAAEAAFGRGYIASDLKHLQPGAKVLEVGAGSLLLSCQLVREGFQVTGLEPTGLGFSHFEQMRQIILARAAALGCLPRVIGIGAEVFVENSNFDYAFSVNVMEHVDDVGKVVANVARSLAVGGSYRFSCPNYLFPYEPHFNIPTLFSKRITERLFRKRILSIKTIPDPSGTWKSLNWINVLQIRKIVQRLPELRVTFERYLLVVILERIACDPIFACRRSPAIRNVILILVRLRMHLFFRFIPTEIQPIIDCRLEKTVDSEDY
ncbi:MAG: hypothetical protein VR65_07975 [Desulfobulbaceae bacterium BRH_c16a]|nr:MAG: hypothetical protein VR65_07975 [Desulfobulbaceae bacterium BRH_c16a]